MNNILITFLYIDAIIGIVLGASILIYTFCLAYESHLLKKIKDIKDIKEEENTLTR